MNFLSIIIILTITIGFIFSFLAKKNNKIIFFILGVFSFLSVPLLYMIIYGYLTNYNIDENLNINRNYSFLIGIVFSYFIYRYLKIKLKSKKDLKSSEIEEIGTID